MKHVFQKPVLLFRDVPQVIPTIKLNAVEMANKGRIVMYKCALIDYAEKDTENGKVSQKGLEPEIDIDIAEFNYYCTLFEDMFSRLEREEEHERARAYARSQQ